MSLLRPLYDLEARLSRKYNVAPVDAESRRRAQIFNLWFDHAIVRILWINQHAIAPGVLRSNQPGRKRLARLARDGLKTVITLRGARPKATYLSEVDWCRDLGLTLHTVTMSDRHAPTAECLLNLIDLFRTMQKPVLIHCKAGADRTGLAAILYLMVIEGKSLAEVRDQLSFRFYHVRRSRAGVLDAIVDTYAADAAAAGGEAALPIETWIATQYDPDAILAAFRAGRPPRG